MVGVRVKAHPIVKSLEFNGASSKSREAGNMKKIEIFMSSLDLA